MSRPAHRFGRKAARRGLLLAAMVARLRLCVGLALALCLVSAGAARATIVVGNNHDTGMGSLRQAISDASQGETIVLPADTYSLASELTISKSVTIAGHGAADTIVKGGASWRVFHTTGAGNNITISGVTIREGSPPPAANAQGGGVLNADASLTLRQVVVINNHANADAQGPGGAGGVASGGGIDNDTTTGTLTLLDSVVRDNIASAVGATGKPGGIVTGGGLYSLGPVTVDRASIDTNTADARGGQGLASGQTGGQALGGGAYIHPGSGSASVTRSTFNANVANGSGGPGGNGGIGEGGGMVGGTNGPPISLANVTVAGNTASALPGGLATGGQASGGGLNYGANFGSATLTNATISGNTATAGGITGGGDAFLGGNLTKVENTLVTAGTSGAGHENCSGTPTSLGHNLDSRDQCNFHAAGDRVNTDPLLGPLDENGGLVQTMALPLTSPAVDAGDNSGCPGTDARGVLRPAGPACDIGAFEVATPAAVTSAATGVGTGGARLNGSATNPDLAGGNVSFQFGKTAFYGTQTPLQAIGATTAGAPFGATVAGLSPSTLYHFRILVANGVRTAFGADRTFTTAAVTPASVAPALRGLNVTPRNVLPQSGRGASITRKRKRGATIAYSDSQAAVTRFTVLRPVRGYRVGRRCQLKRPRRSNAKPRRCTLYRAVGSFSHRDRVGVNRLHFTGRVNRRPLRVGSYRLSAVARNAAGRTSPARSATFRIIR